MKFFFLAHAGIVEPLTRPNRLCRVWYQSNANANCSATQQTFELELPLRDARDAFERAYFEYHLAQESGSMTRVSEKTGLERTHLYRKLKQLGVDLSKPKRVG